jgi:hypothetical protein
MSKAGNLLIDVVKKHIYRRTWKVLPSDVEIVLAQTEENGMIGAALHAFSQAPSDFKIRRNAEGEKSSNSGTECAESTFLSSQPHETEDQSCPPTSSSSTSSTLTKLSSTFYMFSHDWALNISSSAIFLSLNSIGQLGLQLSISTIPTLKENRWLSFLNTGLIFGQITVAYSLFSTSNKILEFTQRAINSALLEQSISPNSKISRCK